MAPEVTMRARISGSRNGKPWPPVGQKIDVPDDEAAQLIRQGIAYIPEETATVKDEVETATVPAGNRSLSALRQDGQVESASTPASTEGDGGAAPTGQDPAVSTSAEGEGKTATADSAAGNEQAKPAAKGGKKP